jgi:adenylate cyclase
MVMAGSLQILVYDRQQKVYQDTFSGMVELGRQRDGKEVLYSSRRDGDRSRVVIARLDEDTVSREHARVEPLANNRAKITNLSAKVSIRLSDNSELRAGSSTEVSLPTIIALGRKTVRIQFGDAREGPIRGLADAPAPPGVVSMGPRFPTLDGIKSVFIPAGGGPPSTGTAAQGQAQMEEIIRWLQTTMEVLHLAASSSDFFPRAAQAAVDIVGLDRARVLVLEDNEWTTAASWTSPKVASSVEWLPSQQILNRVRQEKRTFWLAPEEEELDDGGSLVGVEVVVASPILNPQGDIIGAIYGDARQENYAAAPKITKIEAIVVELLARGVAVGLARIESERAAIAARVQFEQFFTRELSQQLARDPALLEGRDSEVSLLFCDIRGFSRISERLGPEGTVRWVGQVMGALSDCVLKHQGVLVDYIGDELLAMWGAPVAQPDHAQLACLAALDMIGSLPGLNERWEAILGEPLNIGVGINTGVARVGNTGSTHKFKYGPLGNPVNLASRVQGATKYLKCPLLVTQYTQSKLDDRFHTRKLCSVRVINIKQPVDLYELAPADRKFWPEIKSKYEEALKLFIECSYRPAARILGNLLGEVQDDGPSLVLMSRAVNAWVNGPDEQHPVWDLPGK